MYGKPGVKQITVSVERRGPWPGRPRPFVARMTAKIERPVSVDGHGPCPGSRSTVYASPTSRGRTGASGGRLFL